MALVSRRVVLRSLGILFALFAVGDLIQVVDVAMGGSDEPIALVGQHAICAAVGIVAAIGLWRGARWASIPILIWGLLTAVLLITLMPALDLPDDARPGLWAGAAGVIVFAALVAYYARARAPRDNEIEASDAAE